MTLLQVDVPTIARSSGVSGLLRVNVATLLGYLRQAQVAGLRSKMKKEELVHLVLVHLVGQTV